MIPEGICFLGALLHTLLQNGTDYAHKSSEGDGDMEGRHSIIGYALEEVPRPGAREICVRRPPDGVRIRHEREAQHGAKQ